MTKYKQNVIIMPIGEPPKIVPGGFFSKMLDKAKYAAGSLIDTAIRYAGRAIVTVAVAVGVANVEAGTVNPLPLVPPNPTLVEYIDNAFLTNGNIVSIDGINNGNNLAVLWQDGKVRIYDSGMNNVISSFDTAGAGATGITEVPTTYLGKGANIAVSDTTGIDLFDLAGNYKGSKGYTPGKTIQEIDWDAAYNRMLIGTSDGISKVNDDGTVSLIMSSPTPCLESISMKDDYANMFFQNNGAYVFADDGSRNSGIIGKYTMTGMGFTITNGFVSNGDGVWKYAPGEFQSSMDYSIPEPATVGINPLPLVPPNPTLVEYIDNAFLSNGNIVSIDGINNGNNLAVLWQDGKVRIYDSGMNNVVSSFDTGISATGITEVPTTYLGKGANIAVSDDTGVDLFDLAGNYKGSKGYTPGKSIQEIEWDSAYNRMLIGTSDGISKINDDGTATLIKGGSTPCLEAIHMKDDYANMFFQNNGALVFTADGNWDSVFGGKYTNYNQGDIMTGMGFTITNGFVSNGDGVWKFEAGDFQNHMDYSVQEFATCDMNSDGVVNLTDLGILSADWGKVVATESLLNEKTDINDDGVVDITDLSLFAQEWLVGVSA
jgi:WD40 repeat protein